MKAKQEVTIYGAGMSGLVAAINLAREGYHVVLHDREKGYGGDPQYNPSTHTTPIYVDDMSQYIGIDISSAFHPVTSCPFYFNDTRVEMGVSGNYTVERGNRPTSLDTLLYKQAQALKVEFAFKSALKEKDLGHLPPNTIIACGLTPSVYKMLEVPYLVWEGWISRGECGFSGHSWINFMKGITEYGYLSSCNNYYFNLLFSIRPVSRETLDNYRRFMVRHEGMEHDEWHYAKGCVPIADPGNPRLFHKNMIMCGTISGFMDPFGWFGIVGALTSGKIAALAVTDPQLARREFERFSRMFSQMYFVKNQIWYRFIREHVDMMEKAVRLIGPQRLGRLHQELMKNHFQQHRTMPFAIPGFAVMACN
ncbi:MAG: NAD(P)-binding protein [Syntrophaceae bacterium]